MISPIRELFWQNNSLVTHILFKLCPIWYIIPVANFGTHPLLTKYMIILKMCFSVNQIDDLQWSMYKYMFSSLSSIVKKIQFKILFRTVSSSSNIGFPILYTILTSFLGQLTIPLRVSELYLLLQVVKESLLNEINC